jgi:hypothetical protein
MMLSRRSYFSWNQCVTVDDNALRYDRAICILNHFNLSCLHVPNRVHLGDHAAPHSYYSSPDLVQTRLDLPKQRNTLVTRTDNH